MNNILPPIPEKSEVVTNKLVGKDWFNWFKVLREYTIRLLNKYDATKSGNAVLVAGSASVTLASLTATQRILVFPQEGNTNVGTVYVATKTAGVGFTLQSSNASDTRTIFYKIEEAF